MVSGTYTKPLNYATSFNVPLLIHIVVCSTALKNRNMKIIDKILMIAMGLLICFKISWETPLPLIGLLPIIYAIIYLVKVGIDEDL